MPTLQAFVDARHGARASGKERVVVKDFVLEVPLRWGDMDANAAGVL
jgi:hypothetical protein